MGVRQGSVAKLGRGLRHLRLKLQPILFPLLEERGRIRMRSGFEMEGTALHRSVDWPALADAT